MNGRLMPEITHLTIKLTGGAKRSPVQCNVRPNESQRHNDLDNKFPSGHRVLRGLTLEYFISFLSNL